MKRHILGIALLASACVPPKPQPPAPLPPPTYPTRSVQQTVRSTTDDGLPLGATAVLTDDDGFKASCAFVDQRAVCVLDGPELIGTQGHLTVAAPDYDTVTTSFLGAASGNDLADVYVWPSFKPRPRLVRSGEFFVEENGTRRTVIMASDFALLMRFVDGEDIRAVLQQRKDAGYNFLRVWTAFDVCRDGNCPPTNQQIGYLNPSDHLDFYEEKIPAFLRLVSQYDVDVEFLAFAGARPFTADDQRLQHWSRLVATLCNRTGAFLELTNEANHPANDGWGTPEMYFRPTCVMSSHGSMTQDAGIVLPPWDYGTYRPGGGDEWHRKVAHNGMEDVAWKYHIPSVSNETKRFPDNEDSLTEAYDAARGCALLSAGCAFHSVHGKNSTLWEGVEWEAAKAWAAGARSVPLGCQTQPYRRLNSGDYLRVYQRGTDPACLVQIRK